MHGHSVRVTLPICDDLSEYHSEDTIIVSDSDSEHLQDSAHSHESELSHLFKPQDLALSQDLFHSYKHQDLAQCYNSHDMALSENPGHSYELQNPVHLGGSQDSCEPCNLAQFDGSQSYHASASFQVTKDIFTNPDNTSQHF